MPTLRRLASAPVLAALLAMTVALGFALYTQHAWEDYYITYRSSKNLATGHGLVFNLGDRLHTFTSPLGVLLPAVASLLTANSSDPAALWIFRLMCIAALGGGVALLVLRAQQFKYAPVAILLLTGWLITDAKIIDFTINGMETAFMVLFLAYALWAHANPSSTQWRHLGCAWAGLMWTRPDSFIYIGLIAIACWLFQDADRPSVSRREQFILYLQAGLLTTALYLPWLLFSYFYYGSIVPHTVMAKGGLSAPHTLTGLLQTVLHLPFTSSHSENPLGHTFLPAYFMLGGWPPLLLRLAQAVAVLCSVVWLLPKQHAETRAASFAFFGAQTYLAYFPYFPFPWYLPSTTVLAFATLSGLADRLMGFTPPILSQRFLRRLLLAIALGWTAVSGWTLIQTSRQLKAQQTYVENGTRRKIGEWLRAHAQSTDTVFMEPLGYIGFFSGLKTYDFPGMSSREMVEARAQRGNDWGKLIQHLQPNWLVLRPHEIDRLNSEQPDLLPLRYALAQEFSTTDAIQALTIFGQPYLKHDARFLVYKRARVMTYQGEMEEITSQFVVSKQILEGHLVTLVHAPGRMVVKVPPKTKTLEVAYGFPPGAYEGEGELTDGAMFVIEWHGDGKIVKLLSVGIVPTDHPEHRRLQHFRGEIPISQDPAARLVFMTFPGKTSTKDWTCWSLPGLYDHP